ncbi:MAG: hypothetical protein ABIW76_08070, partial [Fibrobacteria bacterium]
SLADARSAALLAPCQTTGSPPSVQVIYFLTGPNRQYCRLNRDSGINLRFIGTHKPTPIKTPLFFPFSFVPIATDAF